jgi:pimeloyl-ACP methyl ester carboxylesterase
MLTEQSFTTGIVAINYAEGPPSGPPLVLLHGVTGRWQSFLSVIPALALRWHIYALDFRGHGRSGRVADAYRFVDYAQDTLAFLRNQVHQPAILLGHSLGAMVALQIAAQAPDSVQAVVLEDPPLYASGTRLSELGALAASERALPFSKLLVAYRDLASSNRSLEEVASTLADIRPDMDAAARRAKTLLQTDPAVLTPILDGHEREGYDTDALLQRIACPVLLLQGNPTLGGQLEDRDAEHASALLAHCTFVRMPGVGHLIHEAPQPELFRRVAIDFLESL